MQAGKKEKKKHLDAEATGMLFLGGFTVGFVSDCSHEGLTGGQEPAGASHQGPKRATSAL